MFHDGGRKRIRKEEREGERRLARDEEGRLKEEIG